MKNLTKHYPTFTAQERFRLFVEGASRRDWQEVDRLNSSCPKKMYQMEDSEFTNRKTQFMLIGLMHANEVTRLEKGIYYGLATMMALEDKPEKDLEELRQGFATLMARRAEKRIAWRSFCQQISLDPDKVMELFPAGDDETMLVAEAIAARLGYSIGPDPLRLDEEVSALGAAWFLVGQ